MDFTKGEKVDQESLLWQGVIAVVGALVTVVIYLYRSLETKNGKAIEILSDRANSLESRADDCENDRDLLRRSLEDTKTICTKLSFQLEDCQKRP